MENNDEWFYKWFDSPYYSILYKNRNVNEAAQFLVPLLKELDIPQGEPLLDLACGDGRYAHLLLEKGFQVTCIDLSSRRIEVAKTRFEGANLPKFLVHDMRKPFPIRQQAAVFLFFTSFGYFENTDDNRDVLENVFSSLRPGGTFLLDYFNVDWVLDNYVAFEQKTIDGLNFRLERKTRAGFIEKKIKIQDGGEEHIFLERVFLYTKKDLEKMLEAVGFHDVKCFGNYRLEPFFSKKSPRLIFIVQKP